MKTTLNAINPTDGLWLRDATAQEVAMYRVGKIRGEGVRVGAVLVTETTDLRDNSDYPLKWA